MSRHDNPLDAVEAKIFAARDFALDSGVVLTELRIAYEAYGTLAPHGRNAVLLTHGFTSHQHMAGRSRGLCTAQARRNFTSNWPQPGPGLRSTPIAGSWCRPTFRGWAPPARDTDPAPDKP